MSVQLGSSSYVGPGETLAAGIVFPVLGLSAVALRFLARHYQKAPIGIDDWLILPALICVVGMGIALIVGVAGQAMGYPTPSENPSNFLTESPPAVILTQKVEFAFQLLMIVAYGLIKLSIIYFYRRIFVISRTFNVVTKVWIVIITLWTLVFFFIFLFSCGSNIWAHWGSLEDISTYCWGGFPPEEGLAISDLITDIMVIALPFPLLWRLHMTISKKISITGVLLLGAVSITASIVRLVIYMEVINEGFDPSEDEDLTLTRVFYWSMIEAGLALIAACLPTLQFLVAKISPRNIMSSIRSVFSLRSVTSQTHKTHFIELGGQDKTASTSHIVQVKAKASHEDSIKTPGDEDGITVERSLEQYDHYV